MNEAEFSRPVRIDTVGAEARPMMIEAGAEERSALAKRFGLVEVRRLSAEAGLVRRDLEVKATGRLVAEVVQSCIATGEPVAARVDEAFEILFRPLPADARPDEEVELSEAEMDVVFYAGASIDIGEAVAETMALALDPYPRAPDAEQALKAAGVKSEEEAGPFGALAALRDKMGK